MTTPVKCVKGHWYHPDPSGKATPCPRCLADSHKVKQVSDDDVLDFLNDPTVPDTSKAASDDVETRPKTFKCSLKRHKKVCPACHCETSFAFEYCPRCGGPLDVAEINVS
jgi:hypothetical protein